MGILKRKTRWTFLALILFVSGVSFSAETRWEDFWEVGFHPGISFPGGMQNDNQTESPYIRVSADYQFAKKVSAGFEAGQATGHVLEGVIFKDIDGDGLVDAVNASSHQTIEVTHVGLFLRRGNTSDWGTWGERFVRTYFIFGTGLYHSVQERGQYVLNGIINGNLDIGGTNVKIDEEIRTDFGINVGFGLGAQIFKRFRVGYDFRYHRIFRNPDDAEYWIPSLTFSYLYWLPPSE